MKSNKTLWYGGNGKKFPIQTGSDLNWVSVSCGLNNTIALSDGITTVKDNSGNNFIHLNAYPNPFSEDLNLEFNLSQQLNISVKLFNLKGELISIIFDGLANEGTNIFVVNGSKLTSGQYNVVFETGNEKISEKVIFIK
ncbi:MAG: T9SS type A sorting domain-containing protein [Candidatus Kapabacteria bacterium]|nr:T9SS type A sorting domain-containing protein [Candidatus Kapabacteria bacterium]